MFHIAQQQQAAISRTSAGAIPLKLCEGMWIERRSIKNVPTISSNQYVCPISHRLHLSKLITGVKIDFKLCAPATFHSHSELKGKRDINRVQWDVLFIRGSVHAMQSSWHFMRQRLYGFVSEPHFSDTLTTWNALVFRNWRTRPMQKSLLHENPFFCVRVDASTIFFNYCSSICSHLRNCATT
jgi:hypothetical protein